MESARLRFALENLGPSDWEPFEQFASPFLTSELPDLRTIAGTGDRGRDAVLFRADPEVVLQYSVAVDWRQKIVDTVKRLRDEKIPVSLLIYATNRSIHPKADDLVRDLRAKGIALDVRDERYFVDRIDKSTATRNAAADLAARVVDPLLPASGLVKNSDLTQPELRAGLLYLKLQLHDADAHRGLTKLALESLTLSALAGTDSEHMRIREDITKEVGKQFPTLDSVRLTQSVKGTLDRLQRQRRVVVRLAENSYALHHSERIRLAAKIETLTIETKEMRKELALRVEDMKSGLGLSGHPADLDAFLDVIEGIFETILEKQGNEFVSAIVGAGKDYPYVDVFEIAKSSVTARWPELKSIGIDPADLAELANETVRRVITQPGPTAQAYLRNLADAYTLLAFLRQTPDVKSAVDHLFSRGRLVLDATVLLPLFGETLLPDGERRFTNLLTVANRAGAQLEVTQGVLEEIERHLTNSLNCFRMPPGRWDGDIPLVLRHWQELRQDGGDFAAFLDDFRGVDHPMEDLADFLQSVAGVKRTDLSAAVDRFDMSTRAQVAEIWRERKRIRRPKLDEDRLDLLLRHDIEMYFGVLGRRMGQGTRGVYGYESWWVTTDGPGFAMYNLARSQGLGIPSRPCMHPSFLSNILALGPARQSLDRDFHKLLPVALDIHLYGWGIPELADAAKTIREQYAGKPEYLIRRHLRDAIDELKAKRVRDDDVLALEDPLASAEVA